MNQRHNWKLIALLAALTSETPKQTDGLSNFSQEKQLQTLKASTVSVPHSSSTLSDSAGTLEPAIRTTTEH